MKPENDDAPSPTRTALKVTDLAVEWLKEKRDALEQELQILKDRKASLDETDYQKELERLISELVELYRTVRDQDSTDEPTAADDSGMPQDAPK